MQVIRVRIINRSCASTILTTFVKWMLLEYDEWTYCTLVYGKTNKLTMLNLTFNTATVFALPVYYLSEVSTTRFEFFLKSNIILRDYKRSRIVKMVVVLVCPVIHSLTRQSV